MFDFFTRLFRGEPSGVKAKERLRLVLLSDHLALAPDVVESLRRDLLDVISRYVEVDMEHVDVTFEQRENEVAMLANVPILSVRDERSRNGTAHSQPKPVVAKPVPPPAAPVATAEPIDASFWTEPVPDAGPAGDGADEAASAPQPAAKPRARRRRRKRAGGYAPAPPPGEQLTAPPPP